MYLIVLVPLVSSGVYPVEEMYVELLGSTSKFRLLKKVQQKQGEVVCRPLQRFEINTFLSTYFPYTISVSHDSPSGSND